MNFPTAERAVQPLDHAQVGELTKELGSMLRGELRAVSEPTLDKLTEVLRSDHSEYSDYDLDESTRLLEIIQSIRTGILPSLLRYDLRSQLVFLGISSLDSASRATQERQFCRDNLNAFMANPGSPLNTSAKKLLRKVLLRSSLDASIRLLSKLDASLVRGLPLQRVFAQNCITFMESDGFVKECNMAASSTHGLEQIVSPPGSNTAPKSGGTKEKDTAQPSPMPPYLSRQEDPPGRNIAFHMLDYHPTCNPLDEFIRSEYPDLPFFGTASLISSYQTCWEQPPTFSSSPQQRLAAASFCYCFALSSLGPLSKASIAANAFDKEGRKFAGAFLDHEESQNGIHYLILVTQYLFAIGNLRRASDTILLAKQRGESLGFLIAAEIASEHNSNLIDFKMGRHIWRHILNTHHSLALRRGRSGIIVDSNHVPSYSLDENGLNSADMLVFQFNKACAYMYETVEDLLDVERIFRLDRTETSFPLDDRNASHFEEFFKVETRLTTAQKSAPAFLSTFDETVSPEDLPLAQRLRTAYQTRRLFMQIRLFRPCLVFFYALFSFGGTESCPKKFACLDLPCYLGFFDHGAQKCMTATEELQEMLKNEQGCELWGSISAYERLDCLYSCALVSILRMVYLYTKSSTVPGEEPDCKLLQPVIDDIFSLFDVYQANCVNNPKLFVLVQSCRRVIDALVKFVSPFQPGSVSDLGLPYDTWCRLFLRIKQPIPQFPFVAHDSNLPITFAWFESVPADLAE